MVHVAKIWSTSHLARRAVPLLTGVAGRLALMARVAAERRALRALDDRQLQDLGLTRVDALREARRPFWDLPRRSGAAGGRAPRAGGRVGRRMAAAVPGR